MTCLWLFLIRLGVLLVSFAMLSNKQHTLENLDFLYISVQQKNHNRRFWGIPEEKMKKKKTGEGGTTAVFIWMKVLPDVDAIINRSTGRNWTQESAKKKCPPCVPLKNKKKSQKRAKKKDQVNYILIDASRRTEEEGRDVLLLFSIDIMRPSRGGKVREVNNKSLRTLLCDAVWIWRKKKSKEINKKLFDQASDRSRGTGIRAKHVLTSGKKKVNIDFFMNTTTRIDIIYYIYGVYIKS